MVPLKGIDGNPKSEYNGVGWNVIVYTVSAALFDLI